LKRHAVIVANNREEMFTNLFCGVIDVRSGTATYCNCGHNQPLVLRRGQRTFEPLRACGPPLGIMDGMTYKPREIALAPSDMLFLYTDGVTEAENWETAQFGMERLEAVVLATLTQPARRVVGGMIACVTAFADGAPHPGLPPATAVKYSRLLSVFP
jgi:sigma-B regulation protein RsbU (phosphoserine phosphatase)